MNACTILVNTCHPYPIGDVIPRERLRSSGIDGIFKRAPNARIRKVAGVVTGSNGIPLPTVNLMPIAQTAAYLNSSSALLMGHFFLPPPPPSLIRDKALSWIAFYLDTTGHLSLRLCGVYQRSHKGYLSILFYSVI